MSAFPAATSPQISCGASKVTGLYSPKDYVTTAQTSNDNIFYRLSTTGISKSQKRQTASGRQTIRISATGAEVTNALNRNQALLLCRLAETVEDFIGIADEELAQSIFDLESRSTTKEDFYELLKKQHSEFNFPPWIAEKFWMAYDLYLDGLHDPRH